MQFQMEDLEKQYKNKTIKQCVDLAKNLNEQIAAKTEEMLGLLWYLERTKRYKEYNGYKHAGFREFVWEVCHISYSRYRSLAWAYNWYPEESREIGPENVVTVRDRVGVLKTPKILKQVCQEVKRVKDPAKKREVINKQIDRHTPVEKKIQLAKDTKAYWRNESEKWQDAYKKLAKEYDALMQSYKELQKQLERQKPAVSAFMQIQDITKAPNEIRA